MEHVLSPFVLCRRLYHLGFIRASTLIDACEVDWEELQEAIVDYQEFHGLKVDGWVGPETEASLQALRFCGHPDVLGMEHATTPCKWAHKNIRWTLTGILSGFEEPVFRRAYQTAWARWSEICAIQPEYTESIAGANVIIGFGAIDGGLGTLAWSELPCGAPRQLRQLYDHNENWVITDGATSGRQIDLTRVACHEIGHVLGIPHLKDGNLMGAMYSSAIWKPQADDITEGVRRYGSVVPLPPPPPPPLPPSEDVIVAFPHPVTRILVRGLN